MLGQLLKMLFMNDDFTNAVRAAACFCPLVNQMMECGSKGGPSAMAALSSFML